MRKQGANLSMFLGKKLEVGFFTFISSLALLSINVYFIGINSFLLISNIYRDDVPADSLSNFINRLDYSWNHQQRGEKRICRQRGGLIARVKNYKAATKPIARERISSQREGLLAREKDQQLQEKYQQLERKISMQISG